jgi:adenylate cyclase
MEEVRILADALERRNKFIRKTFGRYLSDEVVDSLLDTPEGLELGGEKRTVTILMADLRGFSAVSERLHPERVVTMLNNYLGTMTEIIGEYQGTIDEFIGDAILALFGAPVARKDDAERAVACAVAMQLAMDSVNQRNRELGFPEIQMGIAINTGEVVVGNIGSQKRSKYGIVGSQVNLTGRIESYTVGGQILVSQSTVDASSPILKLCGKMAVEAKGFKDPVVVHDLRGIAGKHDLHLLERKEDLKLLVRPVPLKICRLVDKQVCGEEFDGTMIRLSLNQGEMRGGESPSDFSAGLLDNVRIRITGSEGALIPGDLYAKITCETSGGYQLHFTSVPPEIKAFLQNVLSQCTD